MQETEPSKGHCGSARAPGLTSVVVPACAPHTGPSERTKALAKKVAEVKAQHLTGCELMLKGVGVLTGLPFLGLCNFITVPANTNVAIFRFGKLDRMITTPGLHWVAPFYDAVSKFGGTQSRKIDNLHVIDSAGNPIIVSALLEYAIVDPAALHIATDDSLLVLFNMTEQVVRQECTRLPLLGEPGHDIRSQIKELGERMVVELQADASVFGVQVQRVTVVEARYAPEIAAQMLLKQQAGAMVAAREQIMEGAVNIVRDAIREFPTLSEAGKERLVSNLLVTLTSHQQATPTLSLTENKPKPRHDRELLQFHASSRALDGM
eukprot:RCo053514